MKGRRSNLWFVAFALVAVAPPSVAVAPQAPPPRATPTASAPPAPIDLAEIAPTWSDPTFILDEWEASIRLLLSKRLKLILDFNQARLA